MIALSHRQAVGIFGALELSHFSEASRELEEMDAGLSLLPPDRTVWSLSDMRRRNVHHAGGQPLLPQRSRLLRDHRRASFGEHSAGGYSAGLGEE